MKVVLHIDRLVLRGVPADERDALASGLRSALERELSRPGVAAQLVERGSRAVLSGRIAPQRRAQSPSAALGYAAAQVIVGGAPK